MVNTIVYLQGVQRVPTLLLLNPLENLSHLNLKKYTVLDCEPLHDLKGHLIHLCKELPFLLSGEIRKAVEEIISATVSDTMTCADHRIVIIQLLLYLKQQNIHQHLHDLLDTAVRISQLLYLPAEKRTTQNILRLYNLTWYHHELCREMFTHLHAGMTKEKMFGNYLHALVVHAPPQLEIVAMSSVNAEKQERLFSQARKTAIATSNRHPQNVISTLTLRLQAKADLKGLTTAVKQNESRVAKVGKNIQKYSGTKIKKNFVTKHQRSWNEHLPRISPYLLLGEDVWWKESDEEYTFFDGDTDDGQHPDEPQLLHFRSATLEDVYKRQSLSWEAILEKNITLPTTELYERSGTTTSQPSTHITTPHFHTCEEEEESNHVQAKHAEISALTETEFNLFDDESDEYPIEDTSEDQKNSEAPDPVTDPVTDSVTDPVKDTSSATCNDPKQPKQQFKTKHAACIAKLLGPTPKVLKLDTIRFTLKNSSKKPSKIHQLQHEQLLTELQTSVQNIKTSTLKKIKHVEKSYYNAHKALPTEKTCDELAKLLKLYKLASKMLATWHINF